MSFDIQKAKEYVIQEWNSTILESLSEYVRIPNQSPMFDPEIHTNGLQEKALAVVETWIDNCGLKGLKKQIVKAEGRTPVIFLEIPATEGYESAGSILCYSHLDKQPPMLPWAEGLDPYTPVLRDDVDHKGQPMQKLYGRGGADDGYGIYATLTAIKAAQAQGLPHARITMLTEFCEESGSFDLPYYLNLLKEEMGVPDIVVCLDSGCGDYDRLWLTTSLRGMVAGVLTVQISEEGVHSGMGSGVVPSSFRIIRQLLNRIEDAETGNILVDSLSVQIPEDQLQFAKDAVEILGEEIPKAYKFVDGARAVSDDILELYLNRAWRPTLAYTGIGDIPSLQQAGNVLRPKTSMMLSFRLPPTADPEKAAADLKEVLESNPPYGAKVTFTVPKSAKGFYAPPLQSWLAKSVTDASMSLWGNKPAFESCGGTIPFMFTMQEAFPKCQFCVCGLLGPASNAHGPNEFMSVPYLFNLTASMTQMMVDHAKQFKP